MHHVKTLKESREKQRVVVQNMCVANFIAPELRFRSRYMHPEPETPDVAKRSSSHGSAGIRSARNGSPSSSTPPRTPGTPQDMAPEYSHTDGQRIPGMSDDAEHAPDQECHTTEADHQRVFDRAVYLLREAMDLQQPDGGAAVLFDTNALQESTHAGLQRQSSNDVTGTSNHAIASNVPKMPRFQDPYETVKGAGIAASRSAHTGATRERVVLAAASVNNSGIGSTASNYGRADTTFTVTLTPAELQRMCKKHKRGKLFHLPDNVGTSLFAWEGRPMMGRLSAKLYELVLLRRQFPRAHQVIFVPMFHASLNRWTACFVYTNSRFRIFTYEMDYLTVLSFSNLVRSEIARLGSSFAEQRRTDVVGSISHESRSPLHGDSLTSLSHYCGNSDIPRPPFRYTGFYRVLARHGM